VLSTIRLRRREAYQVLADSNRRAAYDQALGGLEAPKRAGGAPTAESHDRVVKIVRQARSMLEQGERDNAITLLLEGVDMDPQDRSCRRLLAMTLGQHPALARTAERHFLIALEQDPHDVELRYRLAVYYRKAGLPTRAMSQLNLVLNQDPRHDKAQRDLEALQTKSGRRQRS
jgi:predicted Zn-dependent protease